MICQISHKIIPLWVLCRLSTQNTHKNDKLSVKFDRSFFSVFILAYHYDSQRPSCLRTMELARFVCHTSNRHPVNCDNCPAVGYL